MDDKFESRITQITITQTGQPTFYESAFTVTINDHAAGEFIVVESLDDDNGKMAIAPEEWETLKSVIDKMIKECRS